MAENASMIVQKLVQMIVRALATPYAQPLVKEAAKGAQVVQVVALEAQKK